MTALNSVPDPGPAKDAAREVDEGEQDDVQVEPVALRARPLHHDQSAKFRMSCQVVIDIHCGASTHS